jgi:MFS family permease
MSAPVQAPDSIQFTTARGPAPLFCIVFLGFLAIAVPLSALAVQVHNVLGFGNTLVGIVVGLQSITTVLTRHRTGLYTDHHGAKRSVLIGLPLAAASGAMYLLSVMFTARPVLSLVVLMIGRVMIGLGESFFVTGAMTWGIGRLGVARTGKVMAWQGIALNAGFALGVPAGLLLESHAGFLAVGLCSLISPMIALLFAIALPGVATTGKKHRAPLHHVLGVIWQQGLVLALATVPFAAMSTFIALYYASRGWSNAGVAVSAYSAGYILIRLLFAHWPDKHGAVRVAMASLVVEVGGQILLFFAPSPFFALSGACLTGMGVSLIFPAMGVAATGRVPAEIRSAAIGNFISFFDIAIGVTGAAIGLIIPSFGYGVAFLVGAIATALALGVLLISSRRDV